MRDDKVLARHHLVNLAVLVGLEAQVAVGHDAHQLVVSPHNGDAADVILGHQSQCIAHGLAAHDGDRVINHAVLGTLYDCHLASLLLDAHILMDYADAALTRYGDGHRSLGDGIHRRGDERNLQLYVTRELCTQRNLAGQYCGISRNKQDVIEGDTLHNYLVFNE